MSGELDALLCGVRPPREHLSSCLAKLAQEAADGIVVAEANLNGDGAASTRKISPAGRRFIHGKKPASPEAGPGANKGAQSTVNNNSCTTNNNVTVNNGNSQTGGGGGGNKQQLQQHSGLRRWLPAAGQLLT